MSRSDPQLVDSDEALRQARLVHRVARPEGQGPFPTVVMLQGRAGNEEVMWVFASTVPEGWLLVAPRAIVEDPDGGYSWRIRDAEEWPTLTQFDLPVGAIMDFVAALPALYNADPQRLYLMGFSQGAAASYAVALRHPGAVQGIAGLVGFVPMDCDDLQTASALEGLPVFMAVGTADERIPYSRSLACAQTLNLAGADLEYHEYDMGHRLNAEAMRDLKAWWKRRAADFP